MMKNKSKTYFKGGLLIATANALVACGSKPPGIDGGVDTTGCYLEKAPSSDSSLAKNRTAIFIGLDKSGQISVGYPNKDFRNILANARTKADFATAVAGATDANMVFYPTSDYVPPAPPNPLDLRTASNTTVAFRLRPEAWDFMSKGFSLKPGKHGGASPFTSSISRDPSVLLVDYDRGEAVTGEKCVYKYNLLAKITSTHGELTSRLPIILDPDWGNGVPPVPPGGSPIPP